MTSLEFRAWNIAQQKMVPDAGLYFEGDVLIKGLPAEINIIRQSLNLRAKFIEQIQKQYILMMFTGIVDESGCKIFEGDVVSGMLTNEFGSINPKPVKSVIKWNPTRACFVSEIGQEWYLLGRHLKVIGNIYEHPNILDNKND